MPNIPSFIPDSRDMLALNGITGYDVNSFIYDKPSTLPIPKNIPGSWNNLNADKFDNKQPKKEGSGWKVFGGVVLGTLATGIAAFALRKKLPNIKLPACITNLGTTVKNTATSLFSKAKGVFTKKATP